jgi:hypothetical protein
MTSNAKQLTDAAPAGGTTTELPRGDEAGIEIGQWYWVNEDELKRQIATRRESDSDDDEEAEDFDDDEDDGADIGDEIDDLDPDIEGASEADEEPEQKGDFRWLGCVVRIGTNYAKLEGFAGNDRGGNYGSRVHFDYFDLVCKRELNAEEIINGNVSRHTGNAQALMAKVVEITRRLGVAPRAEIADGVGAGETQALAVRGSGESIATYKQSLIRAKTEELPALFKQIEKENKIAAGWMTAQIIPLKAQAAGLKPMIKAIEDRIFSVELYAGLTETVTLITDGEPAPIGAKITLMQRRCYMDEESLAQYEAGGMEYKDVEDFDKWIARPKNRDRILPHPRCIVAFRVRRYDKEREAASFRDFVRIFYEREADRQTFLYIRNGEKLYRLGTGIDFGEELFPDLDHLGATQGLYIKTRGGGRGDKDYLITEGLYKTLKAEDEAHEASKRRVTVPRDKDYEGDDEGKIGSDTRTVNVCSCNEYQLKRKNPGWFSCHYSSKATVYERYTPDSVYYDDATQHLADEQARHNRLVLVLQGLLDRSPVLHPHPQWKLWTPDGFMAGLHLVYDSGRALTPGEAPDFEAYRNRLNASLKVGSITVGQEEAWEKREAVKESARQARDWRIRNKSDYRRFKPRGNPGPSQLARISALTKKEATYRWTRKKMKGRKVWVPSPTRPGWGREDIIYDDMPDGIAVPRQRVLNVDAYTPGDFHQFFDDPRTRSEYLQWAPLLLVAEDYVYGKRKVGDESAPKTNTDELPDPIDIDVCGNGSHVWSNDDPDPKAKCDCGEQEWDGYSPPGVGDDDTEPSE